MGKAVTTKFEEKLVLNQWILSLFGINNWKEISEHLKPKELEGMDENNTHKLIHQLTLLFESKVLSKYTLVKYDQNIVRHTLSISAKRGRTIHWKYFQYLSLLFTEIYLDRLFSDPEDLLNELNHHVSQYNEEVSADDKIPLYEQKDLLKLAFWNATGSGKTLLMHINIHQYQYYLQLHNRMDELNRIILLTPTVSLTTQHLKSFESSSIKAERFSENYQSLITGRLVEVIEVTKLKEEKGQITIAIDSFEGNNLVLIDEGHRGTSSESGVWIKARNRLCEHGFSFEYSATFGQAITSGSELEIVYAKSILMNYSYKYFHGDGFGKDFRILNLGDTNESQRKIYFTASLITFFQQQIYYSKNIEELKPFNIQKPLCVFVGSSVNAVFTKDKNQTSDVVDILLYISEIVNDKKYTIGVIDKLLSGKSGLIDKNGTDIFSDAFSYLVSTKMPSDKIFKGILNLMFNSSTPGKLKVENLNAVQGEICIRLGDNKPFALINVGDDAKLCKFCEEFPDLLTVSKTEFSVSMFDNLNEEESSINILIGSRKFTEGWNSWRVSLMGLMNIGKSKGSRVIQLFGRGVRLMGYDFSLKRSSQFKDIEIPKNIQVLETLNIFGIRSNYMQEFQKIVTEEGLKGAENRIALNLPIIKDLHGKKLRSIRIQEGKNYNKDGPKVELELESDHFASRPISLDLYAEVQHISSRDSQNDTLVKHSCKLETHHLTFLNLDAIWFEIQRYKRERGWHNLIIEKDSLFHLLSLENNQWYNIYISEDEWEYSNFQSVKEWEKICIILLKKYVERYYKYKKQEWESEFYEYYSLQDSDPNFLSEYELVMNASQNTIVEKLGELKQQIDSGNLSNWSFGNLRAEFYNQHLYHPLLHFTSKFVEVSPVSLNKGEIDFVKDIQDFFDGNEEFFEDKEMFLLRNMSRGRGIGFFEAGNFFPDFILWVLIGKKQYVSFCDPKGIWNIEGPGDPKINFYRSIKDIEKRMNDSNVILNSFIISNTVFNKVSWWDGGVSKEELNNHHVLFQVDDKKTYIEQLLTRATSKNQVKQALNEKE
jgi:hypothetical protein